MIQIRFEEYLPVIVKWRKFTILIFLGMIMLIPHITSLEILPLPECTFRSLTGYDCPSCGLTRSFYAITHGLIRDSLKYHFAGTLAYIGVLFFFIKFTIEVITGWEIRVILPKRLNKILLLILCLSWLLFWGARIVSEI
jgi:putative Mn2+ efflux pump MntP